MVFYLSHFEWNLRFDQDFQCAESIFLILILLILANQVWELFLHLIIGILWNKSRIIVPLIILRYHNHFKSNSLQKVNITFWRFRVEEIIVHSTCSECHHLCITFLHYLLQELFLFLLLIFLKLLNLCLSCYYWCFWLYWSWHGHG